MKPGRGKRKYEIIWAWEKDNFYVKKILERGIKTRDNLFVSMGGGNVSHTQNLDNFVYLLRVSQGEVI